MVQSFVTAFGSGDGDFQIFLDFSLPDEIIQAAGPETGLQYRIFIS
jgi:hypothetical protein